MYSHEKCVTEPQAPVQAQNGAAEAAPVNAHTGRRLHVHTVGVQQTRGVNPSVVLVKGRSAVPVSPQRQLPVCGVDFCVVLGVAEAHRITSNPLAPAAARLFVWRLPEEDLHNLSHNDNESITNVRNKHTQKG